MCDSGKHTVCTKTQVSQIFPYKKGSREALNAAELNILSFIKGRCPVRMEKKLNKVSSQVESSGFQTGKYPLVQNSSYLLSFNGNWNHKQHN